MIAMAKAMILPDRGIAVRDLFILENRQGVAGFVQWQRHLRCPVAQWLDRAEHTDPRYLCVAKFFGGWLSLAVFISLESLWWCRSASTRGGLTRKSRSNSVR